MHMNCANTENSTVVRASVYSLLKSCLHVVLGYMEIPMCMPFLNFICHVGHIAHIMRCTFQNGIKDASKFTTSYKVTISLVDRL